MRFANPVLAREVRERTRFARVGTVATLVRLVLLIVGAGLWSWTAYTLLFPPPFGTGGGVSLAVLVYALWLGGALTIAAMASASFARERESATWEALKLSLLSSAEIVRAKWLSPLIALALLSAPLWMLFPLGLRWGERNGMELHILLLDLGVIALSLGTISMIGLLVSWRARHPHAALGWVLSVGLVLLIVVPIASEVTDFDQRLAALVFRLPGSPSPGALTNRAQGAATERYARAARFQRVIALWHPITALNFVQASDIEDFRDGPRALGASTALWVQLVVFLGIAGGGGWWLTRVIARDKERAGSR